MIRSAFRQLSSRPGLALVALGILALGLAPLVAGWTAYLRKEAWRHAGQGASRLAWVELRPAGKPQDEVPGCISMALLGDLRAQAPFETVVPAAARMVRTTDEGDGSDFLATHRLLLHVDPAVFSVLGLRMRHGRPLDARDAAPGALPAAVLTERGWRRNFSADPQVVGRVVALQDGDFQVVGVIGSVLPHPAWDDAEFVLPMDASGRSTVLAPAKPLDACNALVRLRPGWNRDRAASWVRNLLSSTGLRGQESAVRPLGGRIRLAELGVILGFGLPAFLVAIAAVSSLLLAMGTARQGETALRGALGASRPRLLGEGLLPALLLCLPAMALAWAPSQGLLRVLAPSLAHPEPDARLFAGLAFLTLLGALAAGFWPAWRASGVAPASLLERGTTTTPRDARHGWARLLVSAQVAVALALLGTSALVWASHRRMLGTAPYPAWRSVVMAHVPMDPALDPVAARETLRTRLLAVDGVQALSLGLAYPLPKAGGRTLIRTPEGLEARVEHNFGDPSLLEVLGLRLRAGRAAQAKGEAVVSEALAHRLWGSGPALGRECLRADGADAPPERLLVVGVCEDPMAVLQEGRAVAWMLEAEPISAQEKVQVMARLASGDARALERFRDGLARNTGGLRPEVFTTAGLRLQMTRPLVTFSGVLRALGLMVLALALSGLAGLVHVMVARRTRELGLRASLGATRARLVGQVILETLSMAGWGVPAGALGVLAAGAIASRFPLFGIQPVHLPSLVSLMILVPASVALAALAPALRASSVQPADALRCE